VEHEELLPEPGEIVSFLAFHKQVLGYPAHSFLLGLAAKVGPELAPVEGFSLQKKPRQLGDYLAYAPADSN
jgi:hypothetical protein